ncbi:MAG: hypothetical protein HRT61_24390 [Ekhidna sp.]|nr:hypothetical protein [Ekhidna sp.]
MSLVHTIKVCRGDNCGFAHTLMLSEYINGCFDQYDFIYISDKYLDSVSKYLPVAEITFVKPFDFQPYYDSEDDEPLTDNSIVSIWYTEETRMNKVPEIGHVTIYENGKSKSLDYLQVSVRKQRMEKYDTKNK